MDMAGVLLMQGSLFAKRYFAFIFSALFIFNTISAQNEISELIKSTLKLNKLSEIDDSLSFVDSTASIDYSTLFNEEKLQKKPHVIINDSDELHMAHHNNNSQNR